MTRALARPRPTRRPLVALAALAASALMLASATGFGATGSTQTPSARLLGMLALTDPVAKGADPPVCTPALAPLDTNGCAGVTFTGEPAKVLNLGSVSGSDVQAGSLRWQVTTTNPFGYRVHMSNAGPAPLLQGPAGSIPDMQTAPMVPAAAVDDSTHFGVAMGNPATNNESAVSYVGSPWVLGDGTQGAVFSGIPTGGGIVIAERMTAQANDPFTATFAVAAIASQQPAPGSYAGTVRIVASAL
jgi:hypothetical protein